MKVQTLIELLKAQRPDDKVVLQVVWNNDQVEYEEANLLEKIDIIFSKRSYYVPGSVHSEPEIEPHERGSALNDPEFEGREDDEKNATRCVVLRVTK